MYIILCSYDGLFIHLLILCFAGHVLTIVLIVCGIILITVAVFSLLGAFYFKSKTNRCPGSSKVWALIVEDSCMQARHPHGPAKWHELNWACDYQFSFYSSSMTNFQSYSCYLLIILIFKFNVYWKCFDARNPSTIHFCPSTLFIHGAACTQISAPCTFVSMGMTKAACCFPSGSLHLWIENL